MAEETANKDIDKRLDKLINLQGTLADRLSSSRVNLEEAKSLSNTSFTLKQAIAEAKQGQVQKAIDTGQGGAIGARFKGTAQGVGWGIKEALGGKRGMKTDKVGALGAAGSMLGTGALHTMGALTGNPLFNLAGTALSNRRKKITSARRSYLDSKAENNDTGNQNGTAHEGGTKSSNEVEGGGSEKINEIATNTSRINEILSTSIEPENNDTGDQNDTAHEGGTKSSNEVEGGGSEKIDEIAANTSRTNEILSGSAETDSEKIADIAAAAAHTNELLDKIVDAENAENAAAQESAEDKNLANDDISSSSLLDGEAEGAIEEMKSAPAESGSMLGDGLKSLLGGGGGMMSGMLSAAMPLLASGLAMAGTAAIGGYIGYKVGGMINEALGLTGDELGNIAEKIGMLPSADDIAKASVKAVQDIKDIGKLEKGSDERGDAIKAKIDELEKRKQEALDDENSFWGRMKTGFNNLVVGEGVVPQESKNLQHEQDTYKRMLENNEAAKNETPNAAPSGNKNVKLKTAKAINSSRSAKSMARKQQKDNVRSYIAEKYSDDGKISISQGAVMINDEYNEAATKEYHEKMYETGVTTKGQSVNMYKLAQQKYNKEQNNTPPSGMNNNTKKSVSEAYESSPSAAQAKTDGENAAKPVVVPMPAPAPAQAPPNSGGSSAPVTPVTTGDGIDYGLSQYNSFQH